MSPNGSNSSSQQPSPASKADVHEVNVVTDPFELFEEARSVAAASEGQERASRVSDAVSERMDRLEGLLEGMVRQQNAFIANQEQQARLAAPPPAPTSEYSYAGSSVFTDFIRAHDRRMRLNSLDESMHTATPPAPLRPPQPQSPLQTVRPPPPQLPPQPAMQQPKMPPQADQQFMPPVNFGIKVPKPRDLDWPSFTRFSGKETYAGVGADFKAWGLRFLQRLGAAEQMSGGVWPEEFKILALNGKLEGTALNYFEKMLPVWTTVSHTLEYVMNSMLSLYMTPIPATKGIEMMSAEKDRSRTWPEHYQFLVYVAERSGNTEQSVLQCLCKSAPTNVQTAMLTRLDTRRTDYLQQAAELVAFAIDFEINMSRQQPYGRSSRGGRSERGSGGRLHNGNRVDQSVRGSGYVARVSSVESRTCYGCGNVGHIKAKCPHRGEDRAAAPTARLTLAVGTGTRPGSSSWILDSGSSVHLVNDPALLKHAVDCNAKCRAANDTMVHASKVGIVELRTVVDGREVVVDLTEVYYSSSLPDNIISYGILEERGVFLERYNGQSYAVRHADGLKIFEVHRRNNVLMVDVMGEKTKAMRIHVVNAAVRESGEGINEAITETTLLELHQRLGHLGYDSVERMADATGSGIQLTDRARPNCLTCAQGKQHKNKQSRKDTGRHAPIDKIGGVIGSDIKGPMTPLDRRGNRYMINFVDYSTNYVRVFVAKNKVAATKMFEHFLVYFEKRFNCRIHVLRTDGGKEYVNVDPFCKETGVRRQISEAENQASNGKAERMHRTVLNMARCMLFASGLPLHFWGDAVEYATYVLNRSMCRANPKRMSPLEMLTGESPNLADMVTFGSPCTAFRDPGKKSWKPRAQVGMIVGKNDETKGFKVYLPKERVVITTQHIKNVETLNSEQNTQLQGQLEREDPDLRRAVIDRDETTKRKETPIATAQVTRSSVTRPTKKAAKSAKKMPQAVSRDNPELERGDERVPPDEEPRMRMKTRNMGAKHVPLVRVNAVVLVDPKNFREAMRDPRSENWKEAMKVEIEALEHNDTWEVIVKPRDAKLLHSKWVYKLKLHANGEIERYKARLVARGDEQVYGVDYTFTFSAVLEMVSGKVILAVSVIWGVPARHGDVPSAYVKADKEEELEILLHIPQGMEIDDELLRKLGVKDKRELALRLKKGLYGLKQSGRLWNLMLHKILLSLGFRQCYTDSCLYVKDEADGKTLVGIYVDDVLVTGTSVKKVDDFFEAMQIVELKDLGVVSKFLGIVFNYDGKMGWTLNQASVIDEMLEKFGLSKAAPVRVPIGGEDGDEDGDLLPMGGRGSPQQPTVQTFQSLVGSLLWVARCTRPDIAFAVHRVTRRSHAPRDSDWRLAKKIAKYLKGTKDFKFTMVDNSAAMSQDGVLVEAFTDADYAADKVDRKSVSGGVLMVAGMVVGWTCKKQKCVALSTMEAEFVAASQVTAEMLGVVELLKEIGVPMQPAAVLYVDNQAAIAQIEGEDTSGRAKHIDVRYKFIKDFAKKRMIDVRYCESKSMRADILTKTLPAPRLDELRELVMLTGQT